MNRSVFTSCLITGITSFALGTIFLPAVLFLYNPPSRKQQEKTEATSFFYRTMYALFEDTYDPEEGSVSAHALKAFREYKPQLGNKCSFFIVDPNPGYYECIAFFPSGDCFAVVIVKRSGRWILDGFAPDDWERSWHSVRHQYRLGVDD